VRPIQPLLQLGSFPGTEWQRVREVGRLPPSSAEFKNE
jgi:hypothetical protein